MEAVAASRAYELEERIVRRVAGIRTEWIALAADLYEFAETRSWTLLGYESLNQWLAQPDVELDRRRFFRLIEAYRELHVERKVPLNDLDAIPVSKIHAVLPAIRRQQVPPAEALADAQVLSRRDLEERYAVPATAAVNKPIVPDDFHYEKCPACGSNIRVRD